MDKETPIPLSAVSGIEWPALPAPAGASMLAVQFQLEQSQWLSAEELRRRQFLQLSRLLSHAVETVPLYRERLGFLAAELKNGVTQDLLESIPLLRRAQVQSQGDALVSAKIPPGHGKPIEHHTSGSTGRPVKTFGTGVTQFFWNALTLRDHLWHRRDLKGKLASIRTTVRDGHAQGWGPSTDVAFFTGPAAMLNIRADVETQAAWLVKENPDYLLSHPSNIAALARRFIAQGQSVPGLREVRTFGETVTPELRELCRRAWGVPLTDAYSAQEIGYMALQCPGTEHYHVQSESVLLEVIKDDGKPCAPGETGRVVITTLHNFAMPLIRYEILDYAEAGGECGCGRGLPVLNRVLGRARNMVKLPDGREHWPSFPAESWDNIAPIRQVQLVQKELDLIVVRTVAERKLSEEEEERFKAVLRERLGYPFRMEVEYREEIERKANSKYEDFVSELPVQGR